MAITYSCWPPEVKRWWEFLNIYLCYSFRLGSSLHLRLKINHKGFLLVVWVLSCINWLFFLTLYDIFLWSRSVENTVTIVHQRVLYFQRFFFSFEKKKQLTKSNFVAFNSNEFFSCSQPLVLLPNCNCFKSGMILIGRKNSLPFKAVLSYWNVITVSFHIFKSFKRDFRLLYLKGKIFFLQVLLVHLITYECHCFFLAWRHLMSAAP